MPVSLKRKLRLLEEQENITISRTHKRSASPVRLHTFAYTLGAALWFRESVRQQANLGQQGRSERRSAIQFFVDVKITLRPKRRSVFEKGVYGVSSCGREHPGLPRLCGKRRPTIAARRLTPLLIRLHQKTASLRAVFGRSNGLFFTNLRSFQVLFLDGFLDTLFCTFIHKQGLYSRSTLLAEGSNRRDHLS